MDESIFPVDVSKHWMNSHFLLHIVIRRKCSFWALLHPELSHLKENCFYLSLESAEMFALRHIVQPSTSVWTFGKKCAIWLQSAKI